MAKTTYHYLQENNLLATQRTADNQFFVTEYTENFENSSALFFGKKIPIEEIVL